MSVVLHVASLSLSLSGPINEGEKKRRDFFVQILLYHPHYIAINTHRIWFALLLFTDFESYKILILSCIHNLLIVTLVHLFTLMDPNEPKIDQ